jgi:hypothetical protein
MAISKTRTSSFRISGSDGKVVQYMPGFNGTFYNTTLPYYWNTANARPCYNTAIIAASDFNQGDDVYR